MRAGISFILLLFVVGFLVSSEPADNNGFEPDDYVMTNVRSVDTNYRMMILYYSIEIKRELCRLEKNVERLDTKQTGH